MAENKMTLSEAMQLANSDYEQLDNVQLAQINQTFTDSFSAQNGSYTDDVQFAANMIQLEAETRIQKYEKLDNFEMADIDGIIALADSLSFSSPLKDQAQKLVDRAAKQKAETLESNANETSEFEVGEMGDVIGEPTQETEKTQEEATEQTAKQDETQQKRSEETNESTQDSAAEEFEENDELTFPDHPGNNITDDGFKHYIDPLDGQLPPDNLANRVEQERRLGEVMAVDESNPYKPLNSFDKSQEYANGSKESVGAVIDDVVNLSAIRSLTVSNQDISAGSLNEARQAESERVGIEFFNAVYGACKGETELDKETPKDFVERSGRIALMLSQNKSKEDIYGVLKISPTKEQEIAAVTAIYKTNAEPVISWAKKLGKNGAKFIDNIRALEEKNPLLSLGMGVALAGNPAYSAMRVALSARGLYKDYQKFKKEHPEQKSTFLGMLKDKEGRKSLAANAGIFLRSVPVVGQAYGATMMAKKLKETLKKSFWKDLGNKFKDAAVAVKEVAKDPKNSKKWKDAWNKAGKPVAIVTGVALTAYSAYKMIDHGVDVAETPKEDNQDVKQQDSINQQMAADYKHLEEMGVNTELMEGIGPDALHHATIHREIELDNMGLGENSPINGGELPEVEIVGSSPEHRSTPEPLKPLHDISMDDMKPISLQDIPEAQPNIPETPHIEMPQADPNIPSHADMHNLAEELRAQIERDGSADVGRTLNIMKETGEFTEAQAAHAGNIIADVTKDHHGNLEAALKEIEKESLKEAKLEFEAEQAAQREAFLNQNVSAAENESAAAPESAAAESQEVAQEQSETHNPVQEQQESQAQEQEKHGRSNEENVEVNLQQRVDSYLADKVARGEMTPEEAREMAPLLLEQAQADQAQANSRTENTANADQGQGHFSVSNGSSIEYRIDENGRTVVSGDVKCDPESFQQLRNEITLGMKNPNGSVVASQAQTAYALNEVNQDIAARMAAGENVPHGEEAIANNTKTLASLGLGYDDKGNLRSVKAMEHSNIVVSQKGGNSLNS